MIEDNKINNIKEEEMEYYNHKETLINPNKNLFVSSEDRPANNDKNSPISSLQKFLVDYYCKVKMKPQFQKEEQMRFKSNNNFQWKNIKDKYDHKYAPSTIGYKASSKTEEKVAEIPNLKSKKVQVYKVFTDKNSI